MGVASRCQSLGLGKRETRSVVAVAGVSKTQGETAATALEAAVCISARCIYTPPVGVFDLGTTGACVTKKIAGAFVSLIQAGLQGGRRTEG